MPPAAVTPPVVLNAHQPVGVIMTSIVARLAALNPTDPTLIALLAAYQAATGQALA